SPMLPPAPARAAALPAHAGTRCSGPFAPSRHPRKALPSMRASADTGADKLAAHMLETLPDAAASRSRNRSFSVPRTPIPCANSSRVRRHAAILSPEANAKRAGGMRQFPLWIDGGVGGDGVLDRHINHPAVGPGDHAVELSLFHQFHCVHAEGRGDETVSASR